MPVALADLLREQHLVLDLGTRQLPVALGKIVERLAANGKVDAPKGFLEQLLAREGSRPSAVENGVAFPHLRTDLVHEIVIGIGRSRSGIAFDGNRARLLFVIGVPQHMASDYLVSVGALARLLRDDVTRRSLLEARTAAEFIGILTASN